MTTTTLKPPQTADDGNRLRALLAANPLFGPVARAIVRTPIVQEFRRRFGFKNSSDYWEKRYQKGRTSGVGSYGRLAKFKAEILNEFVERNCIKSVIEFGCGDGTQLSLARYPRYVGVDVARGSIDICRKRFAGDTTKSFNLVNQLPAKEVQFDLALSLDVVYHLVEDEVFESYMRSLFERSQRFVAIYSSNKEEPSGVPHVRHRVFTNWIKANASQWSQCGFIPNRYPEDPKSPDDTSFADFYFFEKKMG
jgi:SAM-dependent methyltransferase